MVQKLLDSGTGFWNAVTSAAKIKIGVPIARYVILGILLLVFLRLVVSYFKHFHRKTCEKNKWVGHSVAIVLVALLAIFAAYLEESFKNWVIKNFIIVIGLVIMIISLPFLLQLLFSKPKNGEKKSKVSIIAFIIGLLIAIAGAYLGYIDQSNGILFYSKTERSDTLGTERYEENSNDNDGVVYSHELSIRGSKYIFNGEEYNNIEDVKAKLESSVQDNDTVYLTDNYASVLCYKSAEKLLNEIKTKKHIEIKCKTSDEGDEH